MSPITKSAKRSLRKGLKRKTKNSQGKDELKKLLKKEKDLVGQKKIKEAKELLPQVYKALDKAVKTGLIKKNTAARKKARLARTIK